MNGVCEICGRYGWVHRHHRNRDRSNNDPVNIMHLCVICHDWIHKNVRAAYERGWLVHSWDDPADVAVLEDPGAESPSVAAPGNIPTLSRLGDHAASGVEESPMPGAEREDVAASGPLAPGTSCPTCHRRVPHPHKKDSPKTKVFSTRVPVDDAVTFHDMLEATAHHLELHNKPHWVYWTLLHSMVLALQTPHA